MEEKFFSDRIKDKLEFSLKNNYLENILTEWIEEGDEKDRLDTYHILKNLHFFTDKINKQYNLKLCSNIIKTNLNKLILKNKAFLNSRLIENIFHKMYSSVFIQGGKKHEKQTFYCFVIVSNRFRFTFIG